MDILDMPPKASTMSIVCWREEVGNRRSAQAATASLSIGTGRFCLRNGYNWPRKACQVHASGLLLRVTRNWQANKGQPAENYER